MEQLVVETDAGRVRGMRSGAVTRFLGIPYGASTAGSNRFRPPQAVDPWSGVRDALEPGPASPQIVRPGRERDIGDMSEDCLVLNVWTPGLTGDRPVMVWIHGGGFGQGIGFDAIHDGARLATKEDVVVVSINHRLGLLGYLDLERVAGDDYAGSGIAGMLDLVRALEWIRGTISSFGGDPQNVTILGHSGGGGKVSTLLSMPSARGLFHRAAVHGGPPFGYRDPAASAETAERLLGILGVGAGDALARIPTERLLAAQAEMGVGAVPGVNGMLFAPVVGTEHLPERPDDALASGAAAAGIDLMAGTAVDEADYVLFANPAWLEPEFDITAPDLVNRVAGAIDSPERAEDLVAGYRSRRGARNVDLLREIMSDQFLVRTRRLVDAKLDGDGRHAYLYACDVNHGAAIGSFHGVQMPFFFDTVQQASERLPIAATPENLALAAEARHAHASFARSGRPELTGEPWRPYDRESRAQYVFGESGNRVADDPYRDRHELWRDVRVTSRVDPWARLFA